MHSGGSVDHHHKLGLFDNIALKLNYETEKNRFDGTMIDTMINPRAFDDRPIHKATLKPITIISHNV